MCIISKPAKVITSTIIYISKNNLLYINTLTDTNYRDDSVACMCFSFNGNVKTSSIITTPNLKHYTDLYKKYKLTDVYNLGRGDLDYYDCGDEGFCSNFDSVKITFSNGYKIFTGKREEVFSVAIKEYSDTKSVKALTTLMDPNINHGENAVYAIPESKNNDWTGINLEFETPIEIQDIIIPTCHEVSDKGYYSYKQLLLIDIDSFNKYTEGMPNIVPTTKPILGKRTIWKQAAFESIPAPLGHMTICNNDGEKDPYLVYKLDVYSSRINNNIDLTDLISIY